MSMRNPRIGAALTAGLALICVLSPGRAAAQQDPLQGTIRGQVIEAATGRPIPGVQVEVLDFRDRIRRVALADDDGNFILTRVEPGSFWLRASHMGYARTKTPGWIIDAGEILTVNIRMDSEVVPLAPLEVVASGRRPNPVLSGFYARLERGGGGTFFSREDIISRSPSRVTDLLVDVPGLRIQPDGGSGQRRLVTFARSLPGIGGGPNNCPVQLYVDGILATRSSTVMTSPDELAIPTALEGVEVYRGLSTIPAEFLTPEARCGVIALWTRRTSR
jgi:hypothetical protein